MDTEFEKGMLYVRAEDGIRTSLFYTKDDVPEGYEWFIYECIASIGPRGPRRRLNGFAKEHCHNGDTTPSGVTVEFNCASDEDILYFLREWQENANIAITEWFYVVKTFCEELREEEKLRIESLMQSL
jgi:hypothetical protein